MSHQTFWKGVPASVERQERKDAYQLELEAAYAIVNVNDHYRCWATGTKLVKQSADPWRVLTHHHLEAQSQNKARRTDPSNIILLSLAVHRLVTRHALVLVTEAGEKPLNRRDLKYAEWDRTRIPVGREPIALRRDVTRPLPRGRRRG